MNHLLLQHWNRSNRSSRMKGFLDVLSQTGQVEVEYFVGRSFIATVIRGRGQPRLVRENDEWNQVRIRYQGKDALEIFDSNRGPDGRFFNENFGEIEIQQIKNALAQAEICTAQDYWARRRWGKPIPLIGMFLALVGVIRGIASGDLFNVIAFSILTILFLAYFLLLMFY